MKKGVYFPHTIVDNFFDDPDAVRKFGLQQEYHHDETGNWPGKRTHNIEDINPTFFHNTATKILSLFYHRGGSYNYEAKGGFQIVNSNFGSGWVHSDSPKSMTVIFYLSPEGNQGTSLYSIKDPIMDHSIRIKLDDDKRSSTKNFGLSSESCKKNNSFFEETLNVKGLYNRMFLFDSYHWHAAHNFFGEDDGSSRLTYVMFFDFFSSSFDTPMQRLAVNSAGRGF